MSIKGTDMSCIFIYHIVAHYACFLGLFFHRTKPEMTPEPSANPSASPSKSPGRSQSPTDKPTESCPATNDNCLPNGCDGVCKGAIGTIGSNSCFGNKNDTDAASCVNLNGTVGNGSCHGNMTCMGLTG